METERFVSEFIAALVFLALSPTLPVRLNSRINRDELGEHTADLLRAVKASHICFTAQVVSVSSQKYQFVFKKEGNVITGCSI